MAQEAPISIHTYEKLHTAIWHQDARTGQVLESAHAQEPFVAASLAKLYIAAATLSLVEAEQFLLREPVMVSWDQFDRGNYGTGRLRLWTPLLPILRRITPGLEFRLETLLHHSIRFSDNIAVIAVAETVGRDRIQEVVDGWQMKSTIIHNPETDRPNQTTAYDLGEFLLKFGRGELVRDDGLSGRLLNWMRSETIPNREGWETEILSMKGNVTEKRQSYCHIAGYIRGQSARRVFVALTKDQAQPGKDSTYPQQERVRNMVADLAYQTV